MKKAGHFCSQERCTSRSSQVAEQLRASRGVEPHMALAQRRVEHSLVSAAFSKPKSTETGEVGKDARGSHCADGCAAGSATGRARACRCHSQRELDNAWHRAKKKSAIASKPQSNNCRENKPVVFISGWDGETKRKHPLSFKRLVGVGTQHGLALVQHSKCGFTCFVAQADRKARQVPHVRHPMAIQGARTAELDALHERMH